MGEQYETGTAFSAVSTKDLPNAWSLRMKRKGPAGAAGLCGGRGRTKVPFFLNRCARVVELADSLDSGSSVPYGRAGSSPASRTRLRPALRDGAFLLSFSRIHGREGDL